MYRIEILYHFLNTFSKMYKYVHSFGLKIKRVSQKLPLSLTLKHLKTKTILY